MEQKILTKKEFVDELYKDLVQAVQIFTNELFESKSYSQFCTLHKELESNELDHNCLGCNLNDICIYTRFQLEQSLSMDSVKNSYTQIIIALYLLVERIDTILNLIKLDDEYREENFKTLKKIRKWANFIKHPKAFILVHHPVSTFVGCKYNQAIKDQFEVKITNSFINEFYSNDDRNKKLFDTIQNKDKVLVIYPNIIELIESFVKEMATFNQLIRKNEIYRSKLTKMTTFNDYWFDTK